ncbi:MAG: hypothetical protein J07HQW2_00693 [Haloquadratum walsbyi J07HQW2]|uniref:Uncharacterized protein n=1 Tax=Haloquadratum walsbyi J07HQW2 TaxID=1238425 RepID=U1MV29_9EURY|nr:MAG: hypothetical protein J07HQW2_00693 [Haloquadratum walsbyi J07HQW2]
MRIPISGNMTVDEVLSCNKITYQPVMCPAQRYSCCFDMLSIYQPTVSVAEEAVTL